MFFHTLIKQERLESMKIDHQVSELISFLSKNRLFVPVRGSGDDRILTHTLMDGRRGGRVSVPDRDLEAFYTAYGADLALGHPLFVIERRSNIFKMHFDLDLTTLHEDSVVDAMLETLVASVARFLPDVQSKETWCIACAVLNPERSARKSPGLHLVFPWLQIDEAGALWIRSSVLSDLRKKHAALEEDWDKVVDIAVLTTNGLRMVGSDKVRDCPTCRNDREARDFCATCARQGRVAENKVYWPWRTYPQNLTTTLLADITANPAHAARMCSTRVPASRTATPHFAIPEGAPPPSIRQKLSGAAARARHDGRDHWLSEGAAGKLRLKSEPVELTDELCEQLVATFARVHPSYSGLEVRQVDRLLGSRAAPAYSVKVRGFGSRFCQNKMCEHSQQSIYFVITQNGMSQRCFSRKNVIHRRGLCEDFASPPVPLCGKLSVLLFGRETAPGRPPMGRGGHHSTIGSDRLAEALKCNDDMLLRASKFWGGGAEPAARSHDATSPPRERSRSTRGRPAQPLLPF